MLQLCRELLKPLSVRGCSAAVRQGLVARGVQDAREFVSEDLALLQRSKGKAYGRDGTAEAEESSHTFGAWHPAGAAVSKIT